MMATSHDGNQQLTGEGEEVRPITAFLDQLEQRLKKQRRAPIIGADNNDEDEDEAVEPPPLRVSLIDGRQVELPSSVVHLKSRLGGDVFLIGSAHVSQASVNEVTRVIELVRPSTVFVELCPSRAGIIFAEDQRAGPSNQVPVSRETQDNGTSSAGTIPTASTDHTPPATEEAASSSAAGSTTTTTTPVITPTTNNNSTIGQIAELLKRRKEGANILHLVISLLFERVAKNVKIMPGSEFRAAAREGMKHGARIVLGDRPVEITLKRTWGSLNLWEKLKLLYFVIADSSLDIKEEDIERMKNSDLITELIKELSTEFPSLVKPLITERDQYLACKLRACPGEAIVGVVGMGHVAGMVEWWDTEIDLRAICVVPPPGFFTLKRTLLFILLSIILLFFWLVLRLLW